MVAGGEDPKLFPGGLLSQPPRILVGKSQCPVAGQCLFRDAAEDRLARRANRAGGNHAYLATSLKSNSAYHRQGNGNSGADRQPAGTVTLAQCPHIADEGAGLRKEYKYNDYKDNFVQQGICQGSSIKSFRDPQSNPQGQDAGMDEKPRR